MLRIRIVSSHSEYGFVLPFKISFILSGAISLTEYMNIVFVIHRMTIASLGLTSNCIKGRMNQQPGGISKRVCAPCLQIFSRSNSIKFFHSCRSEVGKQCSPINFDCVRTFERLPFLFRIVSLAAEPFIY